MCSSGASPGSLRRVGPTLAPRLAMTTFVDMGRGRGLGVGGMIAATALVVIGCGSSDPPNPSPPSSYSTAGGDATDAGTDLGSSAMPAPSRDGAADPSASDATFTNLYTTIFSVTCAGANCHDPGTRGGMSFHTHESGYASAHAMVRPGDAPTSRLYQVLASGKMPEGGPPLSQAQLAADRQLDQRRRARQLTARAARPGGREPLREHDSAGAELVPAWVWQLLQSPEVCFAIITRSRPM